MKVSEFDFIEMKVPVKAEYVGVLRLTISGIASRMGFSYDAIEDMKVAVSEAASNVVDHAYSNKEKGELTLGFGIYPDRLEIMVSDRGDSFCFEEIKDRVGPVKISEKLDPLNLREGGFGLFLIQALMDKVEINNDYGVVVYMTKYLNEVEVDVNEKIQTKS